MNFNAKEILTEIQKNHDIKEPVVYVLDKYYRSVDTKEDEYPEECTQPLKERKTGIYKVMQWFVDNNYDFNEGEDDCPLELAVRYADATLTSFLIQNGANPNEWPYKGEDPYELNYYYDDIDIAYLNECFNRTDTYVNALLETAKVLVLEGKLGEYSSFCLNVKNGKITIGSAEMTY